MLCRISCANAFAPVVPDRLWRRRIHNHVTVAMTIAAPTATPTPMPAFAPLESSPLLLENDGSSAHTLDVVAPMVW
ncbi:hypothetical protein RRF57_007984 [Xylaria bambusicola]|uniref:Uncharacterized protein n=1 Tax=Xylaria bambusicola TaxID=326684 RepID=A0AAN7Z095_9PEZI